MQSQLLTAIIGGLIAAAVTMTGWFVTDYLKRRDARATRVANFVERQIVELYAPLYFLAGSEMSYRQMREKAVQAASEDKRLAVWWAYSERFVVPAQRRFITCSKQNGICSSKVMSTRAFATSSSIAQMH